MSILQLRCEQSKRSNDWKIDIVLYRDELRFTFGINSCHHSVIARIEGHNLSVLINDFRLVIAHLVDLVRDLVEVLAPDDYTNQFFATEPHFVALNCVARTSLVRERIERYFGVRRWTLRVGGFLLDHLDQGSRDRNLVRTVFRQRNADRVADSVGEKRSNSDRAFDARIFAFARFSHTEMQRIIPVRPEFV